MGKIKLFLVIVIFLLSACSENNREINNSPTSSRPIITQEARTPIPDQTNPIDPTLDWMSQEIEYGEHQVQIIVEAIEEYYQDHSEYPESLEVLIPAYLQELPLTISGDLFDYYQNRTDIYLIGFKLKRQGGENIVFSCGYSRGNDLWECGVSGP